jgi:hypothetical protein
MTVEIAPAPTAPDSGLIHWHTFGRSPVRPPEVDTGDGRKVIVDRSHPSRVIITVVSGDHGVIGRVVLLAEEVAPVVSLLTSGPFPWFGETRGLPGKVR